MTDKQADTPRLCRFMRKEILDKRIFDTLGNKLVGLRAEFVSAAKDAYAALMKDDECAAFLRALDDVLRL